MQFTVSIDSSRLRIPQVREEFLRKFTQEIITTGLEVETDAKLKLTTDEHIDTGRLRASIHTEYKGHTSHNYSDMEGNSFQGALNLRLRELDVIVGTNVVYAQKIERLDSYLFWAFEKNKAPLTRRLRNIINSL